MKFLQFIVAVKNSIFSRQAETASTSGETRIQRRTRESDDPLASHPALSKLFKSKSILFALQN
jgi:hypothetical protein